MLQTKELCFKYIKRKIRPKKIFEESSGRSKLRKIGNILSGYSTEEITYAAQASLNKEGKRRAAFLVNRVASTSPKKMKYVKKLFAQSTSSLDKPTSYTADEALAFNGENEFD